MLFNNNASLFKSQKGDAFSANTMTRMLNNRYKDNGFDGCTSHTGRRSAITKLVNKGISINKVKVIAGHSNIQTTIRYVDTDPIELGEIMKILNPVTTCLGHSIEGQVSPKVNLHLENKKATSKLS